MYLVIIIIINFEEDIKRSFLELRLDLNSPELELECPELELELKLIVSSGIGIGIGIENNGIGIGIELKKWNWPQPWFLVVAPWKKKSTPPWLKVARKQSSPPNHQSLWGYPVN